MLGSVIQTQRRVSRQSIGAIAVVLEDLLVARQ
jgi:hypothetical protein